MEPPQFSLFWKQEPRVQRGSRLAGPFQARAQARAFPMAEGQDMGWGFAALAALLRWRTSAPCTQKITSSAMLVA